MPFVKKGNRRGYNFRRNAQLSENDNSEKDSDQITTPEQSEFLTLREDDTANELLPEYTEESESSAVDPLLLATDEMHIESSNQQNEISFESTAGIHNQDEELVIVYQTINDENVASMLDESWDNRPDTDQQVIPPDTDSKSSYCRLCLTTIDHLTRVEIFGDGFFLGFLNKIKECTGILVEQNDEFSSFICRNCSTKLEEFYNFRLKCEYSDYKLRKTNIAKQQKNKLYEATRLKSDKTPKEQMKIVEKENGVSVQSPTCVGVDKPVDASTFQYTNFAKQQKNKHCEALSLKNDKVPKEQMKIVEKENGVFVQSPICVGVDKPVDASTFQYIINALKHAQKTKKVKTSQIKKAIESYNTDQVSGNSSIDLPVTTAKDIKAVTMRALGAKNKSVNNLYILRKAVGLNRIPLVETRESPPKRRGRHICYICGMSVKNLKNHMPVHGNPETKYTFKCTHCDKAYSKFSGLRVHMQLHQNIQFRCKICDKSFTKVAQLKRHAIVHTGERNFPCHLCDKRFQTAYNLRTHIRSHTGERPYKCPHCELTFTHRATLNPHVRKCKLVAENGS